MEDGRANRYTISDFQTLKPQWVSKAHQTLPHWA